MVSSILLRISIFIAFAFAFGDQIPGRVEHIFSPASSRQIPTHFIARRLQISDEATFQPTIQDFVFEITDKGVLIGPNTNVDLLALTQPATSSDYLQPSSHVVNGDDSVVIPDAYLREGNGYRVVYDGESGTIVNVWGKGLFLEPLHHSLYPRIFVNTQNSGFVARSHDFKGMLPLADPFANVSSRASATSKAVELAVAYDNSYCAIFGNSASRAKASIQAAIGYANYIFTREIDLSIVLIHVESHCIDPSDPYSSLSDFSLKEASEGRPEYILRRFTEIWRSSRGSVNRDLAYFFSGFEEMTSTSGAAYVGQACTSFGYGWVELGKISTFVHELGHSHGARHTLKGTMQARRVIGTPDFFSGVTKKEIKTFLRSSRASCIDTSAPQCDSTCPGGCINHRCVSLYDDNTPSGLVPCVLIQNIYQCTELVLGQYNNGVACPSNFKYLDPIETAPEMRYNVFCCLPPSNTQTASVIPFFYPYILFSIGSSIILPNYIRNPSDIAQGTLLETDLVPSCIAPEGGSPSPSVTPSATPVSSPSPTPSNSPQEVTPMPSQEVEFKTCGSTLSGSVTLACAKKTTTFTGGSIGQFTVQLAQKSGKFTAKIKAQGSLRFKSRSAMITLDPDFTYADLGISVTKTKKRFAVSEDAFGIWLPSSISSCCGSTISLILRAEICDGTNCSTIETTFSSTVSCVDICRGRPGTVVPFSKNPRCPKCLQ